MTMEDPKTFLDIPLTPVTSWFTGWEGMLGPVHVTIRRETDVTWVGGEVTPVYYYVYLRISGPIPTEESQGTELQVIEDYFRKWISDFKQAARDVSLTWPDGWNTNTKTGRLRSDRPNLANSPKPDPIQEAEERGARWMQEQAVKICYDRSDEFSKFPVTDMNFAGEQACSGDGHRIHYLDPKEVCAQARNQK